MKIELPESAKRIIGLLEDGGYEAYCVGGCVRDRVMGKEPNDYDITTSATPDEIKEAVKPLRTVDTGIKHGTVTVICDGEPHEVTTYRIDGEYKDNRRPEEVFFTKNLRDDLSRRDFTVNAMAYNDRDGLVDVFGGRNDLDDRIIRAVGDPEKRFNEDGLRILRALRFASVLDFEIDDRTAFAIHELDYLLDNISKERIFVEFVKLVGGRGAARVLREYPDILCRIIPEFAPSVGFDQKNRYHKYDVYEHTLHALESCDGDVLTKLAVLFHDIGKPYCYTEDEHGGHFYGHPEKSRELCEMALKNLKSDGTTLRIVSKLVGEHHRDIKPNAKSVKRMIAALGEEDSHRMISLRRADNSALVDWLVYERLQELDEIEKVLCDVIAEGECISLKNLPVKGSDLIALGMTPGREMGLLLNDILEQVIDGNLPCDRDKLLAYAKEKIK